MLNLKKVIALVCVFAMMLTTVAFGATYSDVAEDSAYYEAVETLNKLEIVTGYEDGTYKPEGGVTRAEMAALIARIQGYGETAKGSANTGFTDVPASHWASGYVANAAGMGIINGYGDGTFGPEDPVKYEQAVKMIMATLGYTPYAEKNGGYPTGYLAAAQRYDVSLAVSNAAVGQDANRGTVAQLLVNALDTPLMVQASWNTNGEVVYEIADGSANANGVARGYKTLMSENLGYVKIRGIVQNSGLVSAVAAGHTFDTTEDPKVAINVVDDYQTKDATFASYVDPSASPAKSKLYTFLTGETDAADYLGQSVIGYVKKNTAEKYEIISIAVDTNRNDELVIDLDSYAGAGSEADTIAYYKDGDNDSTDIKCESGINVIYNNAYRGTGVSSITGLLTAPVLYGGTIRFIDNDDTLGYDVAIIEAAATAVVKKVTEDGVVFKKGITLPNSEAMAMLEIDADNENKVVAIYKDGAMIDAAELTEWDVLSIISVKENSAVIVAEVVSNKVVGAIQSRKASKTSATGYAYKVADNWYDVATSAYEATASNLEVGIGGAFYVDKYGKIAAFDEDEALDNTVAANYGYIAKVETKAADFSGDGYEVKVQIVTADGVEVVSLKNKAKINLTAGLEDDADGLGADHALADTDKADDEITVDASKWTAGNYSANDASLNILESVVVKYTKNSAGELAEITMADHDSKDKFDAKASFVIGTPGSPSTGAEYDADNTRFVGKGEIEADAKVFIIGGAGTTSITDSKLGTLADLDDKNKYVIMNAYTKDDNVNVIVVDAASIVSSTTSSLAVLTEVGDGVNDEEEAIKILSYYIDGELVEGVATVATTELTGASALSQGDIVKVKVGSNGVITDVKMVFNFGSTIRDDFNDAPAANYTNSNVAQAQKDISEVFAGGKVLDYSDNSTLAKIATVYSDGSANEEYKLSKAANVYVIDDTGLNTVIKVGSDANFKFFEKLYDGTTEVQVWNGNTYVAGSGSALTTVDTDGDGDVDASDATTLSTVAEAQAYADHVYVRAFEGKVTDVVIVKTEKDLKIK